MARNWSMAQNRNIKTSRFVDAILYDKDIDSSDIG